MEVVAPPVCVKGRQLLWLFIDLLVQCVNAYFIARSIGSSIGLVEALRLQNAVRPGNVVFPRRKAYGHKTREKNTGKDAKM